jgi:hypothetical protein
MQASLNESLEYPFRADDAEVLVFAFWDKIVQALLAGSIPVILSALYANSPAVGQKPTFRVMNLPVTVNAD